MQRLESEFLSTEYSHVWTVEEHVITEQGSEVVPLLDATTKNSSKSVTRDEFICIDREMAHVGPQPSCKLVILNYAAWMVANSNF